MWWLFGFIVFVLVCVYGPQLYEAVREFADEPRGTEALARLEDDVATCSGIAQVLVEMNEPLEHRKTFDRPTHYELARTTVRRTCQQAQRELEAARRERLSPDLTRAVVEVRRIDIVCERCPLHNAKRTADGEPFECLAQQRRETGHRFGLNRRGQFTESHQ